MADDDGFSRVDTDGFSRTPAARAPQVGPTPQQRVSDGFERLPPVSPNVQRAQGDGLPPTRLTVRPPGALDKALQPFTSYPSTYGQMNREAREQMGRGAQQLFPPPGEKRQVGAGLFNAGVGAMRYAMSPIDAALRTIVGVPVEENTHGVIKKEWPEFAASLALPGIGLSKIGAVQDSAKAIQRVLSPASMSSGARDAAGLIRAEGGTAARDTAQTEAAIEPFHAVVNKLPDADRLDFIDYVEKRSQGAGLLAYMQKLQPIADTLRAEFDKRMSKLQAMPSTAQMSFIDDYFPHMWKDPGAARSFAQNYQGATKQGSGLSLRARSVPTMADGLAAGLVPATTNPLETTMRYVQSMDRFIASQTVLDIAKDQGTVRYFKPKIFGASGNPQGAAKTVIPDGWVPIKGRGAERGDGATAYAPEDWARVYNNFIDQGIHGNADWGKLYDAARRGSNAITSLELGLSGFHAFTMANEAIVSGVAKGIGEIVGGKPFEGLKSIAAAPAKPVTSALRGSKMADVYLGRSQGTPNLRRITDLLERAGGRAVGKSHAPDYDYSAAGSYWRSFKRGALGLEARAAAGVMRASPLVGTAKVFAQQMGRIMDTVAAPLFEKYIPLVKNGAFYDTMDSWLRMHPNATSEQQLGAARQIWDSIDNRFGEMVQDNIFWNKTLKQTAQLAMRSYSWNMGTVRELGGGAVDILKAARGGEWTPRASYVVALPIVVGSLNAAYQYLKTGEGPRDLRDLVAGRTAGLAPGFGGRSQVEERVSLPGYQKDVLGWWNDWYAEAMNKIATGPRMAAELASNRNWRGDPIVNPESSAPEWMQQYFDYLTDTIGPISIRNQMRGQKEDSNISRAESAMGLGPARTFVQDPEGTERGMSAIHQRDWKRKESFERRQQRQYGGTVE